MNTLRFHKSLFWESILWEKTNQNIWLNVQSRLSQGCLKWWKWSNKHPLRGEQLTPGTAAWSVGTQAGRRGVLSICTDIGGRPSYIKRTKWVWSNVNPIFFHLKERNFKKLTYVFLCLYGPRKLYERICTICCNLREMRLKAERGENGLLIHSCITQLMFTCGSHEWLQRGGDSWLLKDEWELDGQWSWEGITFPAEAQSCECAWVGEPLS